MRVLGAEYAQGGGGYIFCLYPLDFKHLECDFQVKQAVFYLIFDALFDAFWAFLLGGPHRVVMRCSRL